MSGIQKYEIPLLTDPGSMDKNVSAPCEACGGLLPLKPILRRRCGKQLQSPSLQPNQEEPSQREDVSRSRDSHHFQTELGATSHNENLGHLEDRLPSSSNSDGETEPSGKKRSYDSVLEEIQAIFAGQKVKKTTITSYMHLCQRQRERKSNAPKQIERSQAYDQLPSTSKSRSPAKSRRPSHCSFDPLRIISPSPRVHTTQSWTHQLGEQSKREHVVRGELATARCSSPPGSVSMKQKNHKIHRGDVDNHHEACRRPTSEVSSELKPRLDDDCYPDVVRLYEECHIHEIDEHITTTVVTSPRGARNSQRHSDEEREFLTQPQQIIYSCHQHVCQHTVVRHHESCHLHQRDDREDSRKCQRCGCTQQYYSVPSQDGSLHGSPADCKTCHHPPKAHVKTGRSADQQEVTACAQRLSSCNMHVEGCQQKVDVCGVLHQNDLQRMACEDRYCPICKHPCKDHDAKTPGCHLHSKPCPPDTKCQEAKDPVVWTPRRVWKPKPCSVHWLDRITASQNIPSHIVRQYLQGKRSCPPRYRKQKCDACVGKVRDGSVSSRDPCQREGTKPAWNSGSDIAESAVKCKEWKERRGKLSRLALSRVLIVKPVPKVSTLQRLWTRKEFEVCSECRDLKMFRSVGIKSGRWSSILETMSSTGLHDEREIMSSKCSTKYSCHTVHGLSIPGSTRAMDLRGPELNSAFRLRRKLQKLQNETFDRRAAIQVAQKEGIELDKEVFDLLPETKASHKESSRRTHNVRRRKRREVYRGLSKIVELPMPPCQLCPQREVGVQVYKRNSPESPLVRNIWNPSDFCSEVQSGLQPSTLNPTSCFDWPGQEHSNCQAPDQSLDEQHWAYLVEACTQTRLAQGDYGSCHACTQI